VTKIWYGFLERKKVPEEKREIQVLEQVEEKIERKEIKLCEGAIKEFDKAMKQCSLDSDYNRSHGWAVFDGYERDKKFLAYIDETERLILNIRLYADKTQKLSDRLEKDLLDIREGTKDKRINYLSDSENRVLSFGKDLKRHIQIIVSKLKQIAAYELEEIKAKNRGPVSKIPKDEVLGKKIRDEMLSIKLELSGLIRMLGDLLLLEEKVEELTKAYV